MPADYTYHIAAYDQLLLMDREERANWSFDGFGASAGQNKKDVTLACVKHVIEDILGWSPKYAYQHFDERVARMFSLERVIISKHPVLGSYGFMNFTSLDKVNWHYLVHLCYPDHPDVPFRYAEEALNHYYDTVNVKDINKRGGKNMSLTRISQDLFRNISITDEREVLGEFFRSFIATYVSPEINKNRSGYGLVYDLYKFTVENENRLSHLLDVSRMDTIFKKRYVNLFDMMSQNMHHLGRGDGKLWRDVFQYLMVTKSL